MGDGKRDDGRWTMGWKDAKREIKKVRKLENQRRSAGRDGKEGRYVLSSLILAKRSSILYRSFAEGPPNPQITTHNIQLPTNKILKSDIYRWQIDSEGYTLVYNFREVLHVDESI